MAYSSKRRATGKLPAGFPLWKHPSGRWCKKVRGRAHYFGKTTDDPDGQTALEEWLRIKDDLLAGRKPRPKGSEGLTVGRLCNLYHGSLVTRIEMGRLSPRSTRDYRRVTDRLVKFFGPGRSVEDLRPDDFDGLLKSLPKTWGAATRDLFITMARAVFNYAHSRDQELVGAPVRFGVSFRPSSAKEKRRERAERGQRLFRPEDLRRLIDAANAPFKAALLLGINCAYGNHDVGALPWSAIRGEFIEFPRRKTGEPRRAWLWPESRAALDEARKQGRKAADPADAGLVFLSKNGTRMVRLHGVTWYDAIGEGFRDTAKRAGVEGRSFYDLRRTFRTVADETLDGPTINLVMGHVDPTMGAIYRQRIDDARIRRVCEHVREWLFGAAKGGEE